MISNKIRQRQKWRWNRRKKNKRNTGKEDNKRFSGGREKWKRDRGRGRWRKKEKEEARLLPQSYCGSRFENSTIRTRAPSEYPFFFPFPHYLLFVLFFPRGFSLSLFLPLPFLPLFIHSFAPCPARARFEIVGTHNCLFEFALRSFYFSKARPWRFTDLRLSIKTE